MGLIGSLAMHFVVVPGWRARSKAMKEVSDDTDEARTENSNDEDDSEANEDDDELEEEDDDELEEEDDDELDGDDEDDVDEIDIGSHIGLAFEDEEVFGTIIEFDDEEETVTIEEDGSGDVVTGYQKDIFLE
jgi:hypothetical protein